MTPEKLSKKSKLSWTAEHHGIVGSTPPKILLRNPGKTLGELMSENEAEEQIREAHETIHTGRNHLDDTLAANKLKKRILLDAEYLHSIKKISPEFARKIKTSVLLKDTKLKKQSLLTVLRKKFIRLKQPFKK